MINNSSMIKKFILIFLFLTLAGVIYYFYISSQNVNLSIGSLPAIEKEIVKTSEDNISVYISNLKVPWEIAFLPDKRMLVTERDGNLLLIEDKKITQTFKITEVTQQGEGGLLGIAIHPKFSENNYFYLYLTSNENSKKVNKVVRYTLKNNQIEFSKVILNDIRANIYHNAGKIEFGPDELLYITAGDALDEPAAQDVNQLAGKILRVTDEGIIPTDNPFNNYTYSYGHRNPQGLTWDDEGNLWSTEHGQSGLSSGLDELNNIVVGGNYGWPNFRGNQTSQNFISPVIHSGTETWAPGDTEFFEGKIYFTGLRGEALYSYEIKTNKFNKFLFKEFGRLRAITLGPDKFFYVSTSNKDGRGAPRENDDKIIKIDPKILK